MWSAAAAWCCATGISNFEQNGDWLKSNIACLSWPYLASRSRFPFSSNASQALHHQFCFQESCICTQGHVCKLPEISGARSSMAPIQCLINPANQLSVAVGRWQLALIFCSVQCTSCASYLVTCQSSEVCWFTITGGGRRGGDR